MDRPMLTMRRREFLLAAAAAVVAAGTPLPLLAASRKARGAGGGLPVGYLAEGETRAVPADRLPAGDPDLARRGVRITVHGLAEAGGTARRRRESLSLYTHYRVPGTGVESVPVLSWHQSHDPVLNEGTAVSFTAPVDPVDGLRLTLERESGVMEAPARSRGEVRFTAGRHPGRPRLRRGTYLVTLGSGISSRDVLTLSIDPA